MRNQFLHPGIFKVVLSGFLLIGQFFSTSYAQAPVYYITADKVFDGEQMHTNWAVIVKANKIIAAAPKEKLTKPADAIAIYYPGSTLTPGLIEGHSHMLL